MSDDALNKKLKEAAEQYHPAYDEDAWKKMEWVLNRHMPEKKKRRRFFYLPFAVLLLGGLFYILYSQTGKVQLMAKKQPAKDSGTANVFSKPGSVSSPAAATTFIHTDKTNNLQKNKSFHTTTAYKQKIDDNKIPERTKITSHKVNGTPDGSRRSNDILSGQSNAIVSGNDAPVNNNDDSIHDQSALVIDSNNSKSIESTTGIQPAANAKTGDAKQADITKSPERRKPAAGEKKFNGKFAVNISAGPDVSGVSMSRIGRIDLNYGIGFSYALSKRFSLRAGFYVSDKIYSADTTEYKIPYGNNADYLSGIYANCIVYDIPLTVSYTFPKVGNHDWLVSAGLSSYLMKKETYDYLYKYPSGYTDEKKWAIYNQNHHYLSVLDISAGYEYIFSKRTSLIAEPYVQLPLSGVGAGKVKLNSGGILFTVRIKPF